MQFVEAGIDGDGSVLEKGMGWSSKAIGKREFRRHVELEPIAQAGG